MRASVRHKLASQKKQIARRQHERKLLALVVIAFAALCALFLAYSDWHQVRTADEQKAALEKQFAALDTQIKATLQKRIDDAKQAEAAAKSGNFLWPAAQKAANDKSTCDVTAPASTAVVINKKHCFNPSDWEPDDLIPIDAFSLRKEAAEAFARMRGAASAAGLPLELSSAYRSHSTQVYTYSNWIAVNGSREAADTVSARPGYSEHQTGLAVDLHLGGCALECFGTTASYAWLQQHAAEYGFIERYPTGLTAITGYSPEAWHWRYVGPKTAKDMKSKGIQTLEMYRAISGGDYVS